MLKQHIDNHVNHLKQNISYIRGLQASRPPSGEDFKTALVYFLT